MSAEMVFAWTFTLVAAVIGSMMIAVAMVEALPSIIRSTARRTMKKHM